jgi:hypothetical protein
MPERPYSHYTREKTWAALYSQHILAGYAIVPHSVMLNCIAVIACPTPEDAAILQDLLKQKQDMCQAFLSSRKPLNEAPPGLRGIRWAVVLARSSDYYHYHLADATTEFEGSAISLDFKLVVCGLHDSCLPVTVWETRSNTRIKPRVPGADIAAPGFDVLRRTSYGHNVLIGALISGDKTAIAFKATLKPRTRRRIEQEVLAVQEERYHGRPLAFLTEEDRLKIAEKIRQSVKQYHASKKKA